MKGKIGGFFKKHKKVLIIVPVVAAVVIWVIHSMTGMADDGVEMEAQTANLQKQDLQVVINGSGTIEPNDQYTISPMVQGEIVSAPFEEGEVVKKGQLLYQFDTSEAEESIETAEIGMEQARQGYNEEVRAKEESDKNRQLKAEQEGYVKKLYVEKGDTIAVGTVIADIYDNTHMLLEVPFNATDVKKSWVGKRAVVEVGDDEERLSGKVKSISSVTSVLSGNMVVKYVTIEVKNPGGIAPGATATASVAGVDCNSEGSFTVKSEGQIIASAQGIIENLALKEGSYVKKGAVYLTIQDSTIKDAVANADYSVRTSQSQLDSAQKKLEDYEIKAPISGTVIKKTAKAGDSINGNFQGSMAVIYDLSKVKFQMKVDELDVLQLEVGQSVEVTVDALENATMTGHITNISLEASTNGGVTEYPVTVEMDEVGQLLPGMNVKAAVLVSEEKDAMCIPVGALQRGDYVYVKNKEGETVQPSTEDVDVDYEMPEGFHKVYVETGMANDMYVQILSGLSPEDEVYIPDVLLTDAETMLYGGDEYYEDEESADDSMDESAGE